MTNIFPASSLPGLSWSVFKSPKFNTKIQKSISGRQLRLTFQPNPLWDFKLKFSFLRDSNDQRQGNTFGPPNWGTNLNELRTLMGFFLQQQGAATPFLFDDPTDDTVVNGPMVNTTTGGTNGDGTTVTFQLVRQMGNFNEPILAPNSVSAVYINAVLQNPATYSVDYGSGIITFNTAPGNGLAVTASFTYYFLVHFTKDTTEFENFLYQLWAANEVDLESVFL